MMPENSDWSTQTIDTALFIERDIVGKLEDDLGEVSDDVRIDAQTKFPEQVGDVISSFSCLIQKLETLILSIAVLNALYGKESVANALRLAIEARRKGRRIEESDEEWEWLRIEEEAARFSLVVRFLALFGRCLDPDGPQVVRD